MITLRKITHDNFIDCINLEPAEEQKRFVARNIYSLAEAYVALTNGYCIPMPYAIYHDETMVGFIMLSYEKADEEDEEDETVYKIWRLMIDKKYQGMGYGKKALEKALELIRTFPYGEARLAVLSYEPENIAAKNLYASFGFRETGEMDDDEVWAVLQLKPTVLIVTGPCGSGKTTIANLIARNGRFAYISGDEIKDELFPHIVSIADHPEALEQVYASMFQRAKRHYELGESVVIDYVFLGQKRIEEYKKAFSGSLAIKVLLPEREVLIDRDQSRECWTAGEDCVTDLYNRFYNLRSCIGTENYIDNSEETPEETYTKHFAAFGG